MDIFTIAGLYETWRGADGAVIHSFTLITKEADPVIAHLHDRKSLMLMPEQEKLWHDSAVPSTDELQHLQDGTGDYLTCYRVSDHVNKVTENDAGLVVAV